ncbi:GntR family transcriptional regulator [Arthrobacter zhangbolii]|uniref:GntR family transcriptional regulator n=1 Tax=Arthrobacter zhangbolii TaxID=2886936 RepID=A0A9X1S8I2_9MICC|nr:MULTISPECIES: GntR family transcriptional regulator [Arthrobacter]MCC3271948.1 GntR family transcriptional regulator [Arthrobacter zhangbolii]MCC3293854.1 GntR family transcriptional regulator [Arthrobacter zhangbolii]MDN3905023.1 GntR family transcriptional regulator [Arthrobacter sp. YD2]UON93621.1 GntR family transcriptional regulator [Arthrobacter zhangbolii]
MRASDRAYAALRQDIVNWELPPGTVLGEVEQSARLGVSRTPLREALSRLTADGLAAPHSGRGVVVTGISLDTVADLFELRQALECKAAALAAVRGPAPAFHALASRFRSAGEVIGSADGDRTGYYSLVAELDAAIDAAAANAYLTQALGNVRLHLARVRRLAKDNPERLFETAGEHATIADAVASGNPELAAAAVAVHLHKSLNHLRSARTGSPEITTPEIRTHREPA